MHKLLILTFILGLSASAQEEINADDVSIEFYQKYISEKRVSYNYRRGANLIYDCENKHFICANDESVANCRKRNELSKFLKEETYRCLHIKLFKSQLACIKKHYIFQEKNHMDRFCVREE